MNFAADVNATNGLEGTHRRGLRALPGSAAARVDVQRGTRLSGSVDIDSALKRLFPNDPRWDYVVGQRHELGRADSLHWIEVHPASGARNVDDVRAKAKWLLGWLPRTPLVSYPRRMVWVASGKSAFNARDPKLRALALAGVQFVGGHLTI